ncbi:Chromodomain protein [Phytophthora megakarya]|uniref:Chromodomain protein n=1 Tax=Phytophthora megakarya TaxID=4795 RepID=A0A225VHA2_9STRA|nr:Chromodomain protein [Phytophthora megakarya]
MDWFATFGVCLAWVSDQGTHFKNEVIKALQHALGAHHHFTTARCPWANGTVEVVMREALRCFLQIALNNTPAKSLGDHAPITVMTGLPAMSPLDAITLPAPAARAKGRKNSRKASAIMAQYDVGDYVLYADVWAHTRAKLSVKWCGPAQVTSAVSAWIFIVKNLITGDEREVHASRLKFYSDQTLDVTEELLAHIAHNSEGHVVARLLDSRYNEAEKQFELLVNWRGLSSIENSWEPAVTLLEDVPVIVKNFVRDQRRTPKTKKLAETAAASEVEARNHQLLPHNTQYMFKLKSKLQGLCEDNSDFFDIVPGQHFLERIVLLSIRE